MYSEIQEQIPLLRLTAGDTFAVPLQDLFYAAEYNVQLTDGTPDLLSAHLQNDSLFIKPFSKAEGLYLLPFIYNNVEYNIPLKISRLAERTFYLDDSGAEKVTIFGEFNGWNRNATPLQKGENGKLEVTLKLESGRYQYKFFADGVELLDPANPDSVPNGFGGFNSLLTIEPRYNDTVELHPAGFTNTAEALEMAFQIRSIDGNGNVITSDLPEYNAYVLFDNRHLSSSLLPSRNDKVALSIPKTLLKEDFTHRLMVAVSPAEYGSGSHSYFHQVLLINGNPLGNHDGIQSHHDQVIYSLMVDRFRDGDKSNNWKAEHPELDERVNYYGGDLQGVLQSFMEGYFDSLGVNTLWLSPVIQNTKRVEQEFPAPHRWFTAYHGYWPTDPEKVDSRFGDMELLQELVDEAKDRNSNILLDFVANHTHRDHPWFKEHRDWFGQLELPDGRKNLRFWDEYRLTTWFEPYLPSFDFPGSPEAVEAMTDNAVWWLEESGAAGFRHDAVKHIPNRFWRTLTRKIRHMDRNKAVPMFQIGETFGDYALISSYVNNGQLDSQFNFNLFDAIRNTFLRPSASFAGLEKEMQKTFDVYGVHHLMGNPVNSHDKVRFLSYVDGDLSLDSGNAKELAWSNPPKVDNPESYRKMRLYMAYMLTIPGVPIVYYGDEIGLSGSEDPDNRRPMRFGKNLSAAERDMLKESRKLIGLRSKHSALRYGGYYPLRSDERIMAFLRSDFNETLLVAFNKSPEPTTVNVPRTRIQSSGNSLVSLKDLRTENIINETGDVLSLRIGANEWGIWEVVK